MRNENHPPPLRDDAPTSRLFGLGVICLPLVLLLATLPFVPVAQSNLFLACGLFQVAVTLLVLFDRGSVSDPTNGSVIVLYIVAYIGLRLARPDVAQVPVLLVQAALLAVPALLFARLCLRESGALALRRARLLTERLARRKSWPADLHQIRELADVRALRDSLQGDASPAFPLLVHPRIEARLAGLAALEYRGQWRPGQPEYVLGLLKNATEPELKAAALLVLACVEDHTLLEAMAEYLWDETPLVRQAAADALFWNTSVRWPWIRIAVRQGLAHPNGQYDGPLVRPGTILDADVVVDLLTWTAEKGTLANRAALTLAAHYDHLLHHGADVAQVRRLERHLIDPHTPAVWRLEIARLLTQAREVSAEVARSLLSSSNPAPLRLLAIETLLAKGQSGEAVAALTDLARLPNREIALAVAEVVQRRLGVDLGVPRDQTLPPVHSRQAAEIVRRLLVWADHQDGAVDRVPVGRSYDDDF